MRGLGPLRPLPAGRGYRVMDGSLEIHCPPGVVYKKYLFIIFIDPAKEEKTRTREIGLDTLGVAGDPRTSVRANAR